MNTPSPETLTVSAYSPVPKQAEQERQSIEAIHVHLAGFFEKHPQAASPEMQMQLCTFVEGLSNASGEDLPRALRTFKGRLLETVATDAVLSDPKAAGSALGTIDGISSLPGYTEVSDVLGEAARRAPGARAEALLHLAKHDIQKALALQAQLSREEQSAREAAKPKPAPDRAQPVCGCCNGRLH